MSLRPPRPLVSAIQPSIQRMNPLSTCAQLTVSKTVISVTALLDSGSAGNFISGSLPSPPSLDLDHQNLVRSSIHNGQTTYSTLRQTQCGSTTTPNRSTPSREMHLLVLEGSTVDIILRRPWLVQHNPILSWKTGEVLKWGNDCFSQCFPHLPRPSPAIPVSLPIHSTSIESPVEKQSVDIPSCYAPFRDVSAPGELPSYHRIGHGTVQ